MTDIWLFLAAGFVGGAVNAAAGGAKLFVFPMLLAAGLPPLVANATGTVALWPAQIPATWVYRRELAAEGLRMVRRAAPVLVGALAGALALIASSEAAFLTVVPLCLGLAVGAIALGDRLPRLTAGRAPSRAGGALVGVLLFSCGVYGGYFGAGLGFMLLAVLSLSGLGDLQRANAQKNLLALTINTTAVPPLLASGLVDGVAAAGVLTGGLAGGWLGARVTRRIPPRPLRLGVAVLGLLLTASFLMR